MNQTPERRDRGVRGLDAGIESFRSSAEFSGPVEPLDGHHCNDHFAHIYESTEEKYEAAVPFVSHGLDRGDRVVYVVDESSEADVAAALREAGVDVDSALDAGAFSFHTIGETYLRGGSFDPDEMIDFYADLVAAETAEYEALRIVAETTWLQDDTTTVEQFMEYEARVNDLFSDTDSLAICQYDRRAFGPETVRTIIETHPHLIYDGTVCHNAYYTPPEEFFGPEDPREEVDRMLGTLVGRSSAKAELETRQRHLHRQYEIVASPDRAFDEKLQALFELGCEQFGLDLGAMARVDPDADRFEVEHVSGEHEHFEPGVELPLSETYCAAATELQAACSVTEPGADGFEDVYVYEELGIESYLGTYVGIDGGTDRTFFFVASEPRPEGFSDDERARLRLMGQWVKYELEQRRRERFLRESYAITSDPALSFEEKLDRLLEFGCEWFGLEMAGLNHLPTWDGPFRLERGVGFDRDEDADPLWTDPGEERFCRQTIAADAPVSRADVCGTDWAHDPIHREFGLTSYLGTKVTSGSSPYGTLWFGSTEPRDRPFSDTERTFVELMGQWVSYEIERRERQRSQRALYEIAADADRAFDEKLQALFELGCEQFDLDLGGVARIDPDADHFEVERVSGDHDHLEPGAEVALSETYCRVLADGAGTTTVTDPEDEGFEDSLAYREFGVNAYLGTRVPVDGDLDRSLFFVSTESRSHGFSAAERTFLHLMGQWLQYELERERYETELEETIDRLEQSNDRLKQFAYAASHDLQEPLRMVSTYLQLLGDRHADDLDPEAREYIEFAVEGADRMRAMVDDLLAYSRVEQSDSAFERVDCDALLDRVTDDLRVRIEETDATVVVDSLPTLRADPEQLEQLFSNLIANGIKYNESEQPRVEVTADRRGDRWAFTVSDNGIGIDPEKTDRIFEVFKRLHHDDEYPGTGIGLSLCQEIAENHGGTIRVDSEPGEGSAFTVLLPADGDG